MPAGFDQRWERLIKYHRNNFSKIALDGSFRTKNCEGFQAYFSSLAANHVLLKNGSDTTERFVASLQPLRSFAAAVTAVSRDEEGLHIIWAALHALIEVRSRKLYIISRPCAAS